MSRLSNCANKIIEICPHCKSNEIKKYGYYKNRQRYICKSCDRTFTSFTNKPWSYSKKGDIYWEKYLKYMEEHRTLRECSKLLEMNIATAFSWRHRIMKHIADLHKGEKLKDEVSIMRATVKENRKGTKNLNDFPENLHCNYAIDINNNFALDLFGGEFTTTKVNIFLYQRIKEGTKILRTNHAIINACTEKFNKKKFNFESIKPYIFKKFGEYKDWLIPFKGVASKYYVFYHYWFDNIENIFDKSAS